MRKAYLSAILLAATVGATAAHADDLNIMSGGGAYQDSQREAYFKPFEKATGAKIVEDEYNFELAKIKSEVDSGTVKTDVYDLDAPTAMQACAEGITQKIDYAKLGLDKSKFIGGDIFECGVPTILYAYVFAYDTSKMKDGPKSIADVYDLKKFPGKRGLQKSPVANLEWALMADGVAPGDVYKVLGTPEGVDRAFKKLDTIKSEVVWWEAGAQPPQLLADGQVAITSAWNGRIFNAVKKDKKPFAMMWNYIGLDWDVWAMPKGAKNQALAEKFIAFASDAKNQAEQTKYISYGPANTAALPNIAPDVLKDLPTNPANMTNSWQLDSAFWSDHGDELRERFNAWIAK